MTNNQYTIEKQVQAEEDLIDMWITGEGKWGEQQADKYYYEIEKGILILESHPKAGTELHQCQGYRQLHINRHVVIYRILDTTVHIIRVLGDEMDVQRHL